MNRSERHLEAARGYLTLDMPEQALRELRRVPADAECAGVVSCLRGEALRQQECFDEALEAYRHAEADDPSDLITLLGIAWCSKRIDRLDDAIAVMHRAYDAAPNEAVVLYNLACYYALAENKVDALSWLGRALRLDAALAREIPAETDFDSLRNDDDFRFIVDAVTAGA